MWTSAAPSSLRRHSDRLLRIFRETPDKHAAHRRAAPLLQEMAADRLFVRAALDEHLRKPGSLNTRHFPSIGIEIDKNPHYGLVINCFLPAPTGETDVTYNAIHHHGPMLLSTAAAFGPGYEHWLFTPTEVVDRERELFRTKLVGRTRHEVGQVAFVDAMVPHAVMYPASLSLTVAVWSSKSRVSWVDHVKRIRLVQGREKQLRELAVRLGLRRALELKVITYYDFYPTSDGLKGMRERIQFERGPNADYLYSLFHIIQATGNQDVAQTIKGRLSDDRLENAPLIRELLDELQRDRPIPFRYSEGLHYGIDHMNFRAAEIESLLGPCPMTT